jgi:hypothetical protein
MAHGNRELSCQDSRGRGVKVIKAQSSKLKGKKKENSLKGFKGSRKNERQMAQG